MREPIRAGEIPSIMMKRRMFVGRNGLLIYSDDPAVRVNQMDQL
jgi:hypothetical protein